MENPDNRILTIKEITEKFYKFNKYLFPIKNFSPTSYRRFLMRKEFLNYNYKKIPEKASVTIKITPKIELERRNFPFKYLELIEKGYEPIFIDECSFNYNFKPLNGYFPRGIEPRIPRINTKSDNYTLIAACSNRKLYSYQLLKKSVQGPDFFLFISKVIFRLRNMNKKYFLVFDNAKTHKSKNYWFNFKKHFNIINTPPYTPHYNLIEMFFGFIKKQIRKKVYCSEDLLIRDIQKKFTYLMKKNI